MRADDGVPYCTHWACAGNLIPKAGSYQRQHAVDNVCGYCVSIALRCLVCDRSLRDGSPPRCSTAPQQQSLSEQLLPLFESFRPATAITPAAAPGGSSCSPGGPGTGGGSSGRTGSPGRSHGPDSGPAAGTVIVPMGPGLHAAQLRQMSAQKAGRLGVSLGAGNSIGANASSPQVTAAAGGAAGSAGGGIVSGILGFMPVGAGEGGVSTGVLSPGPDGLFVADLVSSNLRISSVHSSGPAAGGAERAFEAMHEASFSGGGGSSSSGGGGCAHALGRPGQQQQQQQQPAGGVTKAAAGAAGMRPQTAVVSSRDERIAAVRPSTAAAAASNRPGTAAASGSGSPLSKGAAGKRTPVFL